MRSKSQLLDVTPTQSPSPPSTRRKGRLGRLQTHTSSDTDVIADRTRGKSRVEDLKAAMQNRDVGVMHSYHTGNDTRKQSQWYDERDIDQFSLSSGELVRTGVDTITAGKLPQVGPTETEVGSAKKVNKVRRNVVKGFSDEADDEKDDHVSIGDTPTQSPRIEASGRTAVVDEENNDDDMGILDLINGGEEQLKNKRSKISTTRTK